MVKADPGLLHTKQGVSRDRVEIENGLLQLIEVTGVPGISLTVIRQGKKDAYSVGKADMEEGVELQEKHRMLIGSTGKSFFAALALRLMEEGKLSLDAPVSNYLGTYPWYAQVPNHASVTIENLLNHTSGIPEYVYTQELWQTIKQEPRKQWTVQDRLAFIADAKPHFETGSGWGYADTNYILLGAVLEEITKKDVFSMVNDSFFVNYGMKDIEPATQPALSELCAGYSGNLFGNLFGEKIASMGQYHLNPQFEWTGGGFVSTTADLALWANLLFSGKVLEPQSLELMCSAVNRMNGTPDEIGYGLGTEIFHTRFGKAFGHTGFMPGYSTFMAYLPDHQMSLAVQVNMDPYHKQWQRGTSIYTIVDGILSLLMDQAVKMEKYTVLYFVRHAEKEDDGTRNPALSQSGMDRAKRLADLMADKGIDAVYSSPYKRAIQTAEPLAKRLNLETQLYNPSDQNAIFDIIGKNKGGIVLIVGHSNTVPEMLNLLGQNRAYQWIAEDDYGKLYEAEFNGTSIEIKQSNY
ncbi:MAG: hypothetical protein Tsb004_30800 [Allomuricauda sp.]